MKKIISMSIIMIMLLSVLLLTGCGGGSSADLSDSKYVGTWKAAAIAVSDESENLDENWVLTLKEDGTGQLTSEEETSDFTWQLTDNGFKTKGDVNVKFTDDGDNRIKGKILIADLIFEKQ